MSSKQLISHVYNNTDYDFYLWLSNAGNMPLVGPPAMYHNGRSILAIPKGVHTTFDRDNELLEIPQYDFDAKYLAISTALPTCIPAAPEQAKGLLLWKSMIEGALGITFVDSSSMRGIYHLGFEEDKGANTFVLIFQEEKSEDGATKLDVVLELRSTSGAKSFLMNLLKQRRTESKEEHQQLRMEAAKALIALV